MIRLDTQRALFGWCMTNSHRACTGSSPSVSNPSVMQVCSCSCHGDQS